MRDVSVLENEGDPLCIAFDGELLALGMSSAGPSLAISAHTRDSLDLRLDRGEHVFSVFFLKLVVNDEDRRYNRRYDRRVKACLF